MFARLAFAVAINVDPDILIIDETLSVGDVAFQARCFKKFQEFQKLGKTILFVTHSTESIVKFCNKGIVLDKGIKMAEGPSREMVELYKKLLVNCNSCNEEIVSNNEDIIENSISWRHSFNINPYFLDYGNKKAEIIDFGIFDANNHPVHTLLNDEEYEFRMKIKFNETIEEPIFAYIIKDLKGTIITGTNNTMEHIISGTFLKDDYIYVTFRQRINLQSQNYMISFGCTGFINEEFVVYHRLYDVIIFDVISDKTISGFFDPKSIISIVKSQN
jgi:teichoic acid transport system ATP-binding protein